MEDGNRRRTTRGVAWIHLIAGVALIGVLCNANAWAQTATTTAKRDHHHVAAAAATAPATGPNEEQRLNALSGQVGNLQKQTDDTTSEVKKIEAAIKPYGECGQYAFDRREAQCHAG